MTDHPEDWPEAQWRGLVERVRAGRRLVPEWPGGASCALALSFDCDHETAELGAGRISVGRLAWGEFGRRVGVPRILDALARFEARATFFVPAVAALIDPDEPRRIAGAGHEVGVHGWIHEDTSRLDEVAERALIARAADALEGIVGRRPAGHRAAHWDLSPQTARLVAEAGFLYDSSMMADEDPYEVLLDGRPSRLVEIPVDWVRDDAVYLAFNRSPPTRPYASPGDVAEVFLAELEGAAATGGLCQIVMHPFVIGYRSRIAILERLLARARELGAWIDTHEAVAGRCAAMLR